MKKKSCKQCKQKFNPLSVWQEYCSDCHNKKKMTDKPTEEEKKVKVKKGEQYKAIEEQIVELSKQGKTAAEISKSFNGHPGIPKIKRVLAAHGINKK